MLVRLSAGASSGLGTLPVGLGMSVLESGPPCGRCEKSGLGAVFELGDVPGLEVIVLGKASGISILLVDGTRAGGTFELGLTLAVGNGELVAGPCAARGGIETLGLGLGESSGVGVAKRLTKRVSSE